MFRDANEQIEQSARLAGMSHQIPFICECADPRCTQIIRLSLAEYEHVRDSSRRFANAPGHEKAAAEHVHVVERPSGGTYIVVEKSGLAAEIVERLDSRTA